VGVIAGAVLFTYCASRYFINPMFWLNPRRPSFARLGNRYHAFLAIDRHRSVQSSGAIAKVLQKFLRVRALHERWLE
jgi:hypothetical protein